MKNTILLILTTLITHCAMAQSIRYDVTESDDGKISFLLGKEDEYSLYLEYAECEDNNQIRNYGKADRVTITYGVKFTQQRRGTDVREYKFIADFFLQDDGRYKIMETNHIVRSSYPGHYDQPIVYHDPNPEMPEKKFMGHSDDTTLYAVQVLAFLREQMQKDEENNTCRLADEWLIDNIDNETRWIFYGLCTADENYEAVWMPEPGSNEWLNKYCQLYTTTPPPGFSPEDISEIRELYPPRDIVHDPHLRSKSSFKLNMEHGGKCELTYTSNILMRLENGGVKRTSGSLKIIGRWEVTGNLLILYYTLTGSLLPLRDIIINEEPNCKVIFRYAIDGHILHLTTHGYQRLD